MLELDLFDTPGPTEATRDSGSVAPPESSPGSSPHAVEPRLVLHPRRDRLWVTRSGDTYRLTVQGGRNMLPLTQSALRDLANVLCASPDLIARLADLPGDRAEDCRLLNLALWAWGSSDAFLLRLHRGARGVFSITPDEMPDETPAGTLTERVVRAISRDLTDANVHTVSAADDDLRIEVVHNGSPIVDLAASADVRRDTWRGGALLFRHAVGFRVVPALFRAADGTALPVLFGDEAPREHVGDPQRLARSLAEDVRATRDAAFGACADTLRRAQRVFLSRDDATRRLLVALPGASAARRDAVVRYVFRGTPTLFRLASGLMRDARARPAGERSGLEIEIGHLVRRIRDEDKANTAGRDAG